MQFGQHHQHMRRRGTIVSKARSKALAHITDVLVYTASTLSLIFTLDQVWIIWGTHNASGVSLLAWSFYTVSASVWILYGWVHKDRIILVTNCFWVVLYFLVVIGVARYG